MEGGIDVIGGAAVVETCLKHDEPVSRHMRHFVWAVEPLDLWRWVTVGCTNELLRITSEHWDCLGEPCGINDGLICWDKVTMEQNEVKEYSKAMTKKELQYI